MDDSTDRFETETGLVRTNMPIIKTYLIIKGYAQRSVIKYFDTEW